MVQWSEEMQLTATRYKAADVHTAVSLFMVKGSIILMGF